ncbi:hypothetical protein FRC20_010570 [Serendipita sp. 405]|nr:hypothetical protein FRC20_010570 [Serendipita sp. 405]
MKTLGSIGTDILHEFLCHSLDRNDLAAFVRSGHVIYDVFKEHPNSILRSVVCNELGIMETVFPYCWETLRLLNDRRLPDVSRSRRQRIVVEQELTTSSLRERHIGYLREIQRAVDHLEKMYSLQFKDSIHRYDSLTVTEAYRFQVAAHLFWQYQSIWQAIQAPLRNMNQITGEDDDGDDDDDDDDFSDEGSDEESDEDDEDDEGSNSQDDQSAQLSSGQCPTTFDPDVVDQQTVDRCNQFLEAQPVAHLFWMQEFRTFLLSQIDLELDRDNNPDILTQARTWIHNFPHGQKLSTDQWRHHLLSTSLFMIYHSVYSFSLRELAPTALSASGLWLTDSLLAILRSKSSERGRDSPSGRILEQKGVLLSQCQKCARTPQYQNLLINVTNAKERRSIVRPDMLPSFLSFNPVEIERLRNRIFGPFSPPDIWWQNTQAVYTAQEDVMEEIITHGTIAAISSLTATDVKPTIRAKSLELSDDEDMEDQDGKQKKGVADKMDDDGDNGVEATAPSSSSVASQTGQQTQEQNPPVVYRWSPLDVLCDSCFTAEFQRLSYNWWLEERQTDSVQPHNVTEDCWWGVECTAQRRRDHAIKLNHCCPKTGKPGGH